MSKMNEQKLKEHGVNIFFIYKRHNRAVQDGSSKQDGIIEQGWNKRAGWKFF
jgi:hypothetical protein